MEKERLIHHQVYYYNRWRRQKKSFKIKIKKKLKRKVTIPRLIQVSNYFFSRKINLLSYKKFQWNSYYASSWRKSPNYQRPTHPRVQGLEPQVNSLLKPLPTPFLYRPRYGLFSYKSHHGFGIRDDNSQQSKPFDLFGFKLTFLLCR